MDDNNLTIMNLTGPDMNQEPLDQLEAAAEKGQGRKRRLVANSLDMDSKDFESFYDCSICLDIAKDPVLTCCGHLFCWPCFYKVSYRKPTSYTECPICRGIVCSESVIPINGKGGGGGVEEEHVHKLGKSGLKIPQRPKASTFERVGLPRSVTQDPIYVKVVEEMRQLRINIGIICDHGVRIKQGLLSGSSDDDDSITSLISSTMSLAERTAEDVETIFKTSLLSLR